MNHFRSLIAASLFGLAITANAATIQTTFDAGLDGWTGTGGTVVFVASGGNPGGHLQQSDADATDMTVFAPAPFLGNLTAFLGGLLSFDAIQIVGTSDYAPFGSLTIRNGANSVTVDVAPPGSPPAVWTNYSVALTAAAFGTTEANLLSVLGNVTSIELLLEFQAGISETAGLDNFQIASSDVPEPGTLLTVGALLIAIGAARLRFA
ncbi:MAG: hypothetical protein JNL98_20635 [Bryobacterales bacterium]|nr:hypothetical protein [Bryobacterales bacterium]